MILIMKGTNFSASKFNMCVIKLEIQLHFDGAMLKENSIRINLVNYKIIASLLTQTTYRCVSLNSHISNIILFLHWVLIQRMTVFLMPFFIQAIETR